MLVGTLAEWDWLVFDYGMVLHHGVDWSPDDEWTDGPGTTSCGRSGHLSIPGMFTRMGAKRCDRCCDAVGYPRGVGSPKNDDACRPLVERRLGGEHG